MNIIGIVIASAAVVGIIGIVIGVHPCFLNV